MSGFRRISFSLTDEDLALVDIWLRQKRDYGPGPSARASMVRKAMWEYMRKNGLTKPQMTMAMEELANRKDPASAQQRRQLCAMFGGRL